MCANLQARLEILCVHTNDQVMHSNVSPPISAVSPMYILTRFLLVQVWSIQIKEQSKTKTVFERISGGLTDLFVRTKI